MYERAGIYAQKNSNGEREFLEMRGKASGFLKPGEFSNRMGNAVEAVPCLYGGPQEKQAPGSVLQHSPYG